jgi:peptidoglycan L-alanyl-D-glutamate endopeptidase CwlK
MINSRKLEDLLPKVAELARHFISSCSKEDIDLLITSTYRDKECQAALYAKGRTAPGRIVTNARPGYSYHNWCVAFDFVPIVHGKPAWNDAGLFERCGVIAESCGLEWAGRWKRFREMAHCQYTGGLTLAELQDGKYPTV